jgi:hypothetical protein
MINAQAQPRQCRLLAVTPLPIMASFRGLRWRQFCCCVTGEEIFTGEHAESAEMFRKYKQPVAGPGYWSVTPNTPAISSYLKPLPGV